MKSTVAGVELKIAGKGSLEAPVPQVRNIRSRRLNCNVDERTHALKRGGNIYLDISPDSAQSGN